MSQQELLKAIVRYLVTHDVPYMLTGSIVSSMQGEPRLTHDIDLVVSCTELNSYPLKEVFAEPRYYLDTDSIRQAIASEGLFNIIDTDTGDKVDFWMLTNSPFDKSRFTRRMKVSIWGEEVLVSTPEDTILAKLRWSHFSGGSSKQITDAMRIVSVNRESLDKEYLHAWVKQLGIHKEWAEMVKLAGLKSTDF
jgi:hypothetical protein